MLKLLRFLWTGSWHEHEWETIEVEKTQSIGMDSMRVKNETTIYTLRCKSCGEIKFKKNKEVA